MADRSDDGPAARNVAVLAVGTELLLGQIIDSNSAWIGGELAAHGFDSLVQVKVGDNPARIEAQLRRLLDPAGDGADAVIVCGGLGPTHDDLTRDVLAAVMGVELELRDDVADVIRAMFAERGRTMPDNNLQQAMVPHGATVIPQTRGTAPGLICPVPVPASDGSGAELVVKPVYAVPGVPHEMKDMFERAILPDLRARWGDTRVIRSRVLRTWGDSESGLAERLEGVIGDLDRVGNPTLAFLASGWDGLKVRLTASADDVEGAERLLRTWEQPVRERLGDLVFGVDDETMESVVLDECRRRGLTLAVAESVTGGLVGGRLTAVPGSSEVFVGGVISYATAVKTDLLGVAEGPVVTESAAAQMAVGVRRVMAADVGLALTGVAGPADQDGCPPGTLFVGIATDAGETVREVRLPGLREQMRQFSVITALGFLRAELARGAAPRPT